MENFFENIWELLKANFPWVLIAFGIIVIIGNVLDWDWIVRPTGRLKHTIIYMFFEGKWGRKGVRVLQGIIGAMIILVGIMYILIPIIYGVKTY